MSETRRPLQTVPGAASPGKGTDMKKCTGCGETKPFDAFHRCASNKDGRQVRCKACRQAHVAATREQRSASRALYRATNREQIAAEKQEWYATHREEILAYQAKYYENNREYVLDRVRRYGDELAPEYRVWQSMKQRCENPRCHAYHWYGGRGISVCKRWADSYDAFIADMGPRPTPYLSLDRIDNDGNYEPGNCRWADAKTQANNRSR